MVLTHGVKGHMLVYRMCHMLNSLELKRPNNAKVFEWEHDVSLNHSCKPKS